MHDASQEARVAQLQRTIPGRRLCRRTGIGVGWCSEAPLCFLFRDGVTVRTASAKTQPPANGACGPDSANAEPLKRAYNYARVASTSREELKLVAGTPDVGVSGSDDIRFADAAREAWQKAWSSDRNALISAAALSGKASGAFR